ncbi:C40 family peptidase [Planococcus sp. ISL-110]|uniref:C40 family peptidase n=1 Tax=Planococcus sp. ISL-110 TaxID=2819167 RepID=UPI003336412B
MKKLLMFLIITVLLVSANPFNANKASAATPNELTTYAKKFTGTPYQFGGTTPSGFDCSGYLRYVFNNFDISIPRTSAEQYKIGTGVSKSNLKEGDMVFFSGTYKAGISHAGIYVGNGNFISATSGGVTIANLNTNPYWAPKYTGARRLDEIKNVATPVSKPALPAGQFYDVAAGHWAVGEIKNLSTSGIITGYDVSMFKPSNDVSRAEAATIIARALKLTPVQGSSFKDVPAGHWAAGNINAVMKAGIVNGRSPGYFAPNAKITRAEISKLLTNAFALQASTSSTSFKDVKGHWAESSINSVTASKLATGYKDGTFKPNANATRAEYAAFVHRAIQK